MKIISTKQDLKEWLQANGYVVNTNQLPEVQPLRVTKWKECCFEPDWIFNDVFVEVPRGLCRDDIGGKIKTVLDLEEQADKVRVRFLRMHHKPLGSRITHLGEVILPKTVVYTRTSMSALLAVIQPHYKYKLKEER